MTQPTVSDHPWLAYVNTDPDNFYDVEKSTGKVLTCVQLHAFGGLLIASFENSDFITALAPEHVVSIAISPDTWGEEK